MRIISIVLFWVVLAVGAHGKPRTPIPNYNPGRYAQQYPYTPMPAPVPPKPTYTDEEQDAVRVKAVKFAAELSKAGKCFANVNPCIAVEYYQPSVVKYWFDSWKTTSGQNADEYFENLIVNNPKYEKEIKEFRAFFRAHNGIVATSKYGNYVFVFQLDCYLVKSYNDTRKASDSLDGPAAPPAPKPSLEKELEDLKERVRKLEARKI